MTLYERLEKTKDCFDTYDTDYDAEVTVDWIDEITDNYDKFCMGIIKLVPVVKEENDGTIICGWTSLIVNNLDVFKEFTEKHWICQYEDDEDELIYQWIKEICYWIAGYTSESVYKEFVENYLPRLT